MQIQNPETRTKVKHFTLTSYSTKVKCEILFKFAQINVGDTQTYKLKRAKTTCSSIVV